jgi:hypothetical protein
VRLPATSGAVIFDAVININKLGTYVDYGHTRLKRSTPCRRQPWRMRVGA